MLASLVYLPTLGYDFSWDDQMLITDNRNLRMTSPFALFGQAFWPDPTGEGYYRPIVALTYWVERRVWNTNPLGYHLTNVLLNCLVAALAVITLSRLLSMPGVNGSSGSSGLALSASRYDTGFWSVLAGGLLFALHPAHVESVAFVSGRTDVLMSVFLLTALLFVLSFRSGPTWLTGAAASLAFGLGLLCKEAAALFPVLALLCLRPRLRQPRRSLPEWLLLGVLSGLTLVYAGVRTLVLAGKTAGWGSETGVQRFFLVVNGFGRYLGQAFWPFHHRLLYSNVEQFAALSWPTLVGTVGLVGLGWLAMRYRSRPLGLGSALFLLFVLPGCNLFPIGLTYFAERLLYLPLLGLILAGIAAFRMLSPGPLLSRLMLLTALSWSAALALATVRRMPVWQNNATLYAAMVREAPDSPNAHYNWGTELDKQGDISGAMAAYRRAVEVSPEFAQAYNNLGVLLERTGDRAGAFLAYRRAMELDSSYATVRYNYAGALKGSGDIAGAIRECRAALALQPYLTQARRNLARLYLETDNIKAAIEEYRAGLALEPDNAELHYGLAGALRASGNPAAAIEEYNRAIELAPDMVAAHNDRAIALDEAGNKQEALRGFKRAVELSPNDPMAWANLGAMFRRLGNLDAAASAYRQVLALDPDFAPAREALEEVTTTRARDKR